MNKQRTAALILAVLLMICCTVPAFGTTAGSASDPLISQSYITGAFKPGFLQTINEMVTNRFTMLHNEYVAPLLTGTSTGSFVENSIKTGGSIALTLGDSVVMTSGTASLTISSGAVVNVTTGSTVSSGARLLANNRYMAVEETRATVNVLSKGVFLCDGTVEITQGTASGSFTDVPDSHWAFDEIEALVGKGIITGRGDGTFDPAANMVRGDFVTVLGRLHGVSPSDYTGSGFSDVPVSGYYAPYVGWASANELVTGYSASSFGPGDHITRAQMATLIVRYAGFAGIALPTGKGSGEAFADDALIADWAYDAVYAAQDAGLINGKTGNVFDPGGNATRAEICALIYRLGSL